VKLLSASDVTVANYLVCTIFVCYACICGFDLLPQRSERWICRNCINVFRRPLTAEARVRARVNPRGICGGQSGTGKVFSEYFGFPCRYHSTIAPYSSITAPWGVRLLWPSSTLSQPRSSVRGFTSDPAHWLETEIESKESKISMFSSFANTMFSAY
jgi:hypothetical protein